MAKRDTEDSNRAEVGDYEEFSVELKMKREADPDETQTG